MGYENKRIVQRVARRNSSERCRVMFTKVSDRIALDDMIAGAGQRHDNPRQQNTNIYINKYAVLFACYVRPNKCTVKCATLL